jgi:hypothetical protein
MKRQRFIRLQLSRAMLPKSIRTSSRGTPIPAHGALRPRQKAFRKVSALVQSPHRGATLEHLGRADAASRKAM